MLEALPTVFVVLTLAAVLVGTAIELVPTFLATDYLPSARAIVPYTPLQLQGRDLYVREGCYLCHSQMIRPMVSETLRYGDFSKLEESMYDHPFQWGSKRTGPDLARVGGKYPDLWHYRHLADPREVVTGSIMPAYPWLFRDKTDFGVIHKKVSVMKKMGVPYTDAEVETAEADARKEAAEIAGRLVAQGVPTQKLEEKEIVALIAYLQRLGADAKKGLFK
jgi:cytochrome c oxidase cbb3-type subunit I/II